MIYPRKCSYLTDISTGDSVNTMSKVLKGNSTSDLCFEFVVERVDGCDDEYANKMQTTVGIQTQPPISPSLIENVQRSDDPSESRFKLCFLGEEIKKGGMPMNIPVNFIFSVFWKPNS